MSSSQYPSEKTEEHPPPQPPRPKATGGAQYTQTTGAESGAEHQYPPVPIPGPPGYQTTTNAPPPQYAPSTGPTGGEPHYQFPPPPTGAPPNQQHLQHYQPTTWTPAQDQYDGPPVMTPATGLATDTAQHGKLSTWDKTRNTSKAGFNKLWNGFEKLGVPVNKLTNKIGSEAFWPQSLDKESDKCARILKSFCSKSIIELQPLSIHIGQS
jgi:hypothetical protein